MDQTKLYAIIVTAVLILWWPAWYFFTTQAMTLEIQEKDEKIEKALDTLRKAKSSIEKKDEVIKTQSWEILSCNDDLQKKSNEIKSLKADLENAFAWISDDIISTEDFIENTETSETILDETNEEVVFLDDNSKEEKELISENLLIPEVENCPVCEECKNNTIVKNASWNSFDEKIELETMDLAYNAWFWKKWLPYLLAESKDLLDLYNSEDEVLKAKVWYFCSDEYLEPEFYWNKKKAIVLSYQRSYCTDEKYENCPSDIKEKIDYLKSDNVLNSNWVRILTKYNEEDPSEFTQEINAFYNDFWETICAWSETTLASWTKSYVKIK